MIGDRLPPNVSQTKRTTEVTDSFQSFRIVFIRNIYAYIRHNILCNRYDVIRGYRRGIAERWSVGQDEEKEETEVEFAPTTPERRPRVRSFVFVFLPFTFRLQIPDDMHEQLQVRRGETSGGSFRNEGGHRGQQLEPVLDRPERERGASERYEEVSEGQSFPRDDGDL